MFGTKSFRCCFPGLFSDDYDSNKVKELQQHPIRYTLAMFDVEYIACLGFDELKQDTAKQRSMNIEVYYKLISRFGSVGDDNNLR
jgi:hypothetical protein